MNDRIYVIAGNYDEFRIFAKKKIEELLHQGQTSLSLSTFIYVDREDKLNGLSDIHGYFYGSFRDRPDIRDIIRKLRICNNLHPSETIIPWPRNN